MEITFKSARGTTSQFNLFPILLLRLCFLMTSFLALFTFESANDSVAHDVPELRVTSLSRND